MPNERRSREPSPDLPPSGGLSDDGDDGAPSSPHDGAPAPKPRHRPRGSLPYNNCPGHSLTESIRNPFYIALLSGEISGMPLQGKPVEEDTEEREGEEREGEEREGEEREGEEREGEEREGEERQGEERDMRGKASETKGSGGR
ncbi:uncharacterized protein F4807DRAFT_463182 [Annulohypoxylon truncatum]|uniref:uncharacterized protein n=1 Tax=Annulohypoxylon truncatum TaxID=327061 RepID=UPI0020077FB2|nr:uncharacterized protein F4807DRAFT_463182 [Annulohypoxylon truncatum]KAI1206777.1 hypothetical protein F4807DRAFT_463182 [Annulohypoxylon truncatum]